MIVEQTSPTTFELQTDNGCHSIAGFAVVTMGPAGVYWHRDGVITREDAEKFFRKDPRVKEAIARQKA